MMNKKLAMIKGFTLIELLVAITILGILIAAGVPGMQTLLGNMSVSSTADRLLNTISYARGEALSRSTTVTVCSSDDSATCSGDWVDGWIVIDTGSNEVLRVESGADGDTTITGASVNYNNRGENADGAVVTFTIGSTRTGISVKQVSVSRVGYASI